MHINSMIIDTYCDGFIYIYLNRIIILSGKPELLPIFVDKEGYWSLAKAGLQKL